MDALRKLNFRDVGGIPALRGFVRKGLVDAFIAGETPTLVHCTAGKDRTGVLIALLLQMVGVTEDEILRDYLLSDQFRQNSNAVDVVKEGFRQKLGFDPDDEMLAPIIGVESDFLAAAFEGVTAMSGSADDYFKSAGIDDSKRARFSELLVEVI